VIADNLSAHKTEQVHDFLTRHPKVHLHFTPTYSSWLDQIELSFSKIERDVIARVHVGARLVEKAHEVHPALQQRAQDCEVALL
jgi:transposase